MNWKAKLRLRKQEACQFRRRRRRHHHCRQSFFRKLNCVAHHFWPTAIVFII